MSKNQIENYKVEAKLQPFYNGGPVCLIGDRIYCLNGSDLTVVDVNTGAVLYTFEPDGSLGTALTVSNDGSVIVVATRALAAHVLEPSLEEGKFKRVRVIRNTRFPFTSLALSPDGHVLACGASDGFVRIIRLQGDNVGTPFRSERAHQGIVRRLIFTETGMLFSLGDDGMLARFDIVNSAEQTALRVHARQGTLTSAFIAPYVPHSDVTTGVDPTAGDSPDHAGELCLYVGSRDGSVAALRLDNLQPLRPLIRLHDSMEGIVMLTVEEALKLAEYSGMRDGVASIIAGEGEQLKDVKLAPTPWPWVLVAGGASSALGFYHPYFGRLRAFAVGHRLHVQADGSNVLLETRAENSRLDVASYTAVDKVGSSVVLTTTHHAISIFSLSNESFATTLFGDPGEVADLSVAGDYVCVAAPDGARVFSRRTGQATELIGHAAAVLVVRAFCTEQGVYCATGSKDSFVRVWRIDLPGCPCVAVSSGFDGAVSSLAVCLEQLTVFAGTSKGMLHALNLEPALSSPLDGKPVALPDRVTISAHAKSSVQCLTSTKDGRVISGGADKKIKLWSFVPTKSGGELHLLSVGEGHRRTVYDVSLSPSGHHIASADGEGQIRLWSIPALECVRTFDAHSGIAFCVRWISNGFQLASTGADGLLKVWAVKTGSEISALTVTDSRLWALSVVDDGEVLFAGDSEGYLMRLRNSTEETRNAALEKEAASAEAIQKLNDAQRSENWSDALRIALDLQYMRKCRDIVEVLNCRDEVGTLSAALKSLDRQTNQLPNFINYCAQWNTQARTANIAQFGLAALFDAYPLDYLCGAIPHGKDIINGLLAYTKRHYERVRRLQIGAQLAKMALHVMNVVPEEAEVTTEEPKQQLTEEHEITARVVDLGIVDEPDTATAIMDNLSAETIEAILLEQLDLALEAGSARQPGKQSSLPRPLSV